MAIKTKHNNNIPTYFITFTCINWLPLIETTNCYDIIYKWFQILKAKHKTQLISYVIMPNHLHLILHFEQSEFNLNSIISNGKRFIAYEIIKRLKMTGNHDMLEKLNNLISERERLKGQRYKVFKDSFDAKSIITKKFLLQKINYIHQNPVKGKWSLATDYVSYPHSSASFYETGYARYYTPLHYADIPE